MSSSELLPSLNLLTLIAVAVIVAVALFFFLRRPGNRHPMDTPQERAVQDERDQEIEAARDKPRP